MKKSYKKTNIKKINLYKIKKKNMSNPIILGLATMRDKSALVVKPK